MSGPLDVVVVNPDYVSDHPLLSSWAGPCAALLGLGLSEVKGGASYLYGRMAYNQGGLERDGFGLLCLCLLLPLVFL